MHCGNVINMPYLTSVVFPYLQLKCQIGLEIIPQFYIQFLNKINHTRPSLFPSLMVDKFSVKYMSFNKKPTSRMFYPDDNGNTNQIYTVCLLVGSWRCLFFLIEHNTINFNITICQVAWVIAVIKKSLTHFSVLDYL